ncbi:MAG TPA: hypothetical protein VLD13_12280 [Gaiellaceae bacterium]|nr:hypothetical protein [Gaiellaceae bacterium]
MRVFRVLEGEALATRETPFGKLILDAGTRCRAYRWPREAPEATVFLAAYPKL